jgi:hypothetical protein
LTIKLFVAAGRRMPGKAMSFWSVIFCEHVVLTALDPVFIADSCFPPEHSLRSRSLIGYLDALRLSAEAATCRIIRPLVSVHVTNFAARFPAFLLPFIDISFSVRRSADNRTEGHNDHSRQPSALINPHYSVILRAM